MRTRDRVLEFLKSNVSERRLCHIHRVHAVANALNATLGLDSESLDLAVLLHDCLKEQTPATMSQFEIRHSNFMQDVYDAFPKIWHGFFAPEFAEQYFGFHDLEVLEAVSCHSTGQKEMGSLARLLFVADFLDPEKSIGQRNALMDLAKEDLIQAVFGVALLKLRYLIQNGFNIHENLFFCYNSFYEKLDDESRKCVMSMLNS